MISKKLEIRGRLEKIMQIMNTQQGIATKICILEPLKSNFKDRVKELKISPFAFCIADRPDGNWIELYFQGVLPSEMAGKDIIYAESLISGFLSSRYVQYMRVEEKDYSNPQFNIPEIFGRKVRKREIYNGFP